MTQKRDSIHLNAITTMVIVAMKLVSIAKTRTDYVAIVRRPSAACAFTEMCETLVEVVGNKAVITSQPELASRRYMLTTCWHTDKL